MTIEEMLNYLGVRTQSEESIKLCYLMDMEAFNMMSDKDNNYKNERFIYTCIYKLLLDQLNYQKLDNESLNNALEAVKSINLDEEDKEYRDKHFTGLERILLRYNRHDLIGFQRIKESSIDGMAKDAYLYELNGDFLMAKSYYEKLGYKDRIEIVEKKQK